MTMKRLFLSLAVVAGSALVNLGGTLAAAESGPAVGPLAWPPLTRDCRPHAYWWWLGSAVDRTNITRELERYQAAGLGGVHIIPIYGAKGWEKQSLSYLSPPWMEMLRHSVAEARRLDLNVDMTTGTGWCFGGPQVTDREANAGVINKIIAVPAGGKLAESFDPKITQAVVAYNSEGKCLDLTDRIGTDGVVDWTAAGGPWQVYAISQQPSGTKVKRAAPGGAGHMLNLFYGSGMQHYLERFDQAFAGYQGPKPRAMYHDSYEYSSNWSPDLLAQFERRRGYRLQAELPALLGKTTNEHTARVKCDYRETLSDLMVDETLPLWVKWCHQQGILTRNQAHGSPGNLLDLYALADIPETEMFDADRSKLVSKFASSAAHVAGRRLVAAETGTWLREHFTGTLADMKNLFDDLFLAGVNHVIYHGTCYSPDEVPWPGWQFYASYEMNPRNSIWRDVPALNTYAARCQSVLQHGQPDNDILLYWPLHDFWQNNGALEQKLTVHARDWLEKQPIGKAAERLWQRGYTFDYLSDRQVASAGVQSGRVEVPGGQYAVIAVPACEHIPVPTLTKLLALAKSGATVIFERQLPHDVPGAGNLEPRRAELRRLIDSVKLAKCEGGRNQQAAYGRGRILTGDLESALDLAQVAREPMTDMPGIMFVRRSFAGGRHYFVANRGEQSFAGWLPLGTDARSVVVMDAMTGHTGIATVRHPQPGKSEVWLALSPGESLILRALEQVPESGPAWPAREVAGQPVALSSTWDVSFLQGGPQLPPSFQTARLASWTELGGEEAQRFAGTAVYSTMFDAPIEKSSEWWLNLGTVCQSARVRLNGQDLGTLITPPFRVAISHLKPTGNRLEVEVTNLSANRIRDLDRRKVPWKSFHEINYVNIQYKPFDASGWPLYNSGLLGPVTLTAITPAPAVK